jgi:hypothetical protein
MPRFDSYPRRPDRKDQRAPLLAVRVDALTWPHCGSLKWLGTPATEGKLPFC